MSSQATAIQSGTTDTQIVRSRTPWVLKAIALTSTATLALCAQASQHIVNIAWDAAGRFEVSPSVAAGKFVEVCGELRSGELLRWSFVASAPLDFNIHYHLGKTTEYPVKMEQKAKGDGELRPSLKETYCWMWTNKSTQTLRVDIQLQR